MKNIKGIIIGLIVGVIVAGTSVFALTGTVQKNVNYNNIKITLDGKEVIPTDANGAYVEPFTIDGTTYLPVRAIANALGLNVDWDGETSTVILGKKASDSQATGNVVYDKNGIRVSYGGYIDNQFQKTYKIVVENTGSSTLFVRGYDFYADGFLLEHASFGAEIDPGKKHVGTIYVTSHELQELGLTDITNFEFKLDVNDRVSYTDIVQGDIVRFGL